MTINERVKVLRKDLGLTQTEFGEKIGVAQGHLTSIEQGKRTVTEKTQKVICLQFNVNEEWLRNGIGEMFNAPTATYIDSLVEKYSLDALDRQVLEGYAKLDANKKAVIKGFILDIANSYIQEQKEDLSLKKEAPAQPAKVEPVPEDDIEKNVEAYRQSLLAEKEGQISSALQDGDLKNA